MKNTLNHWHDIKNVPCPKCKNETYNLLLEEKTAPQESIFQNPPAMRLVLICTGCKTRHYIEDVLKI